jgi:type III restriction enzyme
MSITFKNSDFVLKVNDNTEQIYSIINKYDAYLDVLCSDKYYFLRNAVKEVIKFFFSDKYRTLEELAIDNYNNNEKLRQKFENVAAYLNRFDLKEKKSVSLDLATGTGKSWAIYGIAQIMLSEGLVDKVLVLCPSLTIEEGLKDKFNRFSGDQNLQSILKELGAIYPNPAIKSANDPILEGDICVENIHAVYERTGSSVYDSFKGKGRRVLVLNDEAHHIYSGIDSATKKWLEFLNNEEFGFYYIVGLSGTPYIEDDYFSDIIYRFGLKQAIEEGVVKKIDYKLEEESQKEKGFYEALENHRQYQSKYESLLKPITIVITDKIVSCIKVWKELVEFISEKESLSFDEAKKKVIWITSSIPGGNDGTTINGIIEKPEKIRKENLELLKTVDDLDNPVEWIVSVSMLTEGWDVKNVFQIMPHENRAFNSKLLISQVLGRGLRIPPNINPPILVKINNHEKWTPNIENIYKEVLEIENTLSWGFYEKNNAFLFPLYNLSYKSSLQTVETKKKKASTPENISLSPQSKEWIETSIYLLSGSVESTIENKDIISIESAAKQLKIFLNEKDSSISEKWTNKKLKLFIEEALKRSGNDSTYISKDNLVKIQQSFGPMFRNIDEENPRYKLESDNVFELKIENIVRQSFSESSLKNNGYLFYSLDSSDSFVYEEKILFSNFLKLKENLNQVKELTAVSSSLNDELKFLDKNFIYVERGNFRSPLNVLYVKDTPEFKFTLSLLQYSNLFDSILKSPDKGFYQVPYSYKPSKIAKSHVKNENFNPDFFIKINNRNEILVVEIKSDSDDNNKNRAKLRDASKHFEELNNKLKSSSIAWNYFFYFLSPQDYTDFFTAIRENRHPKWKSNLMNQLSKDD